MLRIEDTDAERNRPELIDNILEMLRWLGIEWDGEPVHQSDAPGAARRGRRAARRGRARVLVRVHARGRGPPATRRAAAAPGYDGFCRDRGLEPRARPGAAVPHAARGRDRVARRRPRRGPRAERHLEDFVVAPLHRAPLFLVANAIDDADMGITHVIRGEDHVSNTPR